MKRASPANSLTAWELEQLANLRDVRQRLDSELQLIHRQGSIVEAFANQTPLLTHILAYAWRSTNALMRTCKRFLAIASTRDYWRALAHHALAQQGIPTAIMTQVDWFYDLTRGDPVYSFLWSCIARPNYKPVPRFAFQKRTLYFPHFCADEISGAVRRVLRLRWNKPEEGEPYWYSLAIFCIAANRAPGEPGGKWWTPVYVTYFGHPRLRKRMFVTQERSFFSNDNSNNNNNRGVIINCYTEILDTSGTRVWHGEGPCLVREADDDAPYSTYNPRQERDWGTYVPLDSI